jgi:hypothetical protein
MHYVPHPYEILFQEIFRTHGSEADLAYLFACLVYTQKMNRPEVDYSNGRDDLTHSVNITVSTMDSNRDLVPRRSTTSTYKFLASEPNGLSPVGRKKKETIYQDGKKVSIQSTEGIYGGNSGGDPPSPQEFPDLEIVKKIESAKGFKVAPADEDSQP